MTGGDTGGLFTGQTQGVLGRQFAGQGSFVEIGGSTASGTMPIWRNRSSRRGEAEARTSRGALDMLITRDSGVGWTVT